MLSKNIKHNKIKNVGLLFELLARQLTADVLEDKKSSVSATIIKEFFFKDSELRKELDLYQKLIKSNFVSEIKAANYVDIIVEARHTINHTKLRKEKYNIIRKISENFNIDSFFKSRIDNYATYASIYKLFEYSTLTESQYKNIHDLIDCKFKIVEHLTRKNVKKEKVKSNISNISDILAKENMSIRLLTQKIIIDDFNKNFSNKLNESQKMLIRNYINGITNTNSFMDSVYKCIPIIVTEMTNLSKLIQDIPIRIKLVELTKGIDRLKNAKSINDDQFIALLKVYSLIEEIQSNLKKHNCGCK